MTRHEIPLWSYASKELELGDHRYVEAHLEECPECVDQLASIHVAREALELAREARPQLTWEATDERIGAMVEKRLQAQARAPFFRRLQFVGLTLATAAGLLLAVTWNRDETQPITAIEQPAPISSWARVDKAEGLSRVGAENQTVPDGTELHGGDVLRTSLRGRAFVHLPDASHLRVGSGSQLALTRSEADDVALTLERGRLAVRASHQSRKGFVVHSGGVSVHVVGTVFGVTNDAEVVEVSVTEGKVRVELPNGDATFVEPGQRLRFDTRTSQVKRLKVTGASERELQEVAAVDDATTAVEEQAMVPAVGGKPTSPPMLVAQGTPRSLPRLSPEDARARQVTAPLGMSPDELAPLPKVEAAPAKPEPVAARVEPRTEVVVEAPAEVWPTMGGDVVRGIPQGRVTNDPPPASDPAEWAEAPRAPAPTRATTRLSEDDAPASAPAPSVTSTAKVTGKDLETVFLQRAEEAVVRADCERFLLGLEDIAQDPTRSPRTEQARVLRARCFDVSMRPRQALSEYRKYLGDYPVGRYAGEAHQALGE